MTALTLPEGQLPWVADAYCRDYPADAWFVESQQQYDAKSICQQCPVRMACLQLALDTNEQHGIWGGLNPDERRALRRKQQRTTTHHFPEELAA